MEFEKLGSFYLGKEYDISKGSLADRLQMYDSRDLTTHAVCIGMTGSGKTGLCIDLLEEAAIDGVPAILIDPKGDITNLLLTFPGLRPEDFKPWVNPDDARRKGQSIDEFSKDQSELWTKGLGQWGQDGKRIERLKQAADFIIYTPGSDAGVPVSILQSFNAPHLDWSTDTEVLRDQIQGTVGALLGLIGIDADPITSREHILLANIFEHFWRNQEDLNLPKLILSIQNPPMRKLGVFDLDTFYPQKERFALSMKLNNLIASPSFQSWLEGQPLDIPGFLATPNGKPRHSIFYIAHLSDAERMFFVTMLLNQVITWMRSQPGTNSLRAVIYMDEVFGFFPPVANPPSKKPLLTLLKQARAFGVGVVLTTQNPVDLDYKGLTNAGTWFIGRLQTERDKARVLDGLENASTVAGKTLNKQHFSRIISGLGKRVFLLHNVNEDEPSIFQTRWAMSYLRGPLTRTQVKILMEDREPDFLPILGEPSREKAPSISIDSLQNLPPSQLPGINYSYMPVRRSPAPGTSEIASKNMIYIPSIHAAGRINFIDRRRKVDSRKEFDIALILDSNFKGVDWNDALDIDARGSELLLKPEKGAVF